MTPFLDHLLVAIVIVAAASYLLGRWLIRRKTRGSCNSGCCSVAPRFEKPSHSSIK